MNSAPANTPVNIANMSQAPYGSMPAGPGPFPSQGPPPSRGSSRLPTIIATVIALIAIAVAIGAWFRPAPKAESSAPKTYSEQETADAKKAVCDAFNKVHQMLETNSSNTGTNPNEELIAAVNTRLAIHAAGDFLALTLHEQPATPGDLADKVRALAGTYGEITVDQLGQASRTQLDAEYQQADSNSATIAEACK